MPTVPNPERKTVTMGLVYDVFKVLEAHGFTCGDDLAIGSALPLLGDMIDAYEGRIDSLRHPRTYPAPEVPGE